jgi:RNA polymerase sigma-70 factor, ECF subfamily
VFPDECVNEDERVFEEVWRRDYARVFRAAYLLTFDVQEAADVTQEAFARAFERRASVFRLDNPGAWIQRVAVNLAISWRRRQRVRRRAAVAAPQRHAEIVFPYPGLVDALGHLSPAQRGVVALRFYADQSVEETARALGKRPGTVKALTSQAVHRLRALIEEAEDDVRR